MPFSTFQICVQAKTVMAMVSVYDKEVVLSVAVRMGLQATYVKLVSMCLVIF